MARRLSPASTAPSGQDLGPPNTDEVAIADTRRMLGWAGYKGPVWNPDVLAQRKGGLTIYDEMRADEQVKACLAFRTATIIGPGWDLQAASEDAADIEFAQLLTDDLLGLPTTFEDVLGQFMTCLAYGFSLGESLYVDDQRGIHIRDIKVRGPHAFLFDQDVHGNVTGVRQTVGMTGASGEPWPPEKFIHIVNAPEFSNPYGQSDLRAAYPGWFGKQFLWQLWMTWSERYADPPAMAKLPAGTDNAQRDAMLRILDRLQARSSFSLPPNWDVTLLESTRQPREVFEVAINRCDVRIAKAILVPEKVGLVAGAVEGGSYALAQTQFDVAILLRQLDAQRLEAAVQNQLIVRMAAYRDASRPPPQFTLKPLTQDNTQAMVTAYDALVKDGTILPGVRDETHWRQLLGLPELGEDEQMQREELRAAKRAQVQVPPDGQTPPDGEPPTDPGANPADKQTKAAEYDPHGMGTAVAYWRSLTPIEVRADMAEKAATLTSESDRLGKVLTAGVQALIRDVKQRVGTLGLARPGAPVASIKGLTLRPAFLAALRTSVQDALQAAYEKAGRQGRGELSRARADHAERFAQLPGLVGQRALAFFQAKAFYITGLIEDDILKRVQQVLFNAVKGDKPERTVLLEMDQALGDWLPTLDAQGNTVNVPAREETIARTNVAEAIAEGRFAAFSDPDLPEGFVQALQHSAILDDRVRDSHRAMDGVTLPVDAWMGPPDRRPPGGFNCRCTLIPVVLGDGVAMTPESEIPTDYPDPGFR